MRRASLRLKIAAFAAALVALAIGLVAYFTVIQPWRAKLRDQENIARGLVQTALPMGIEAGASAIRFDPQRVHQLVTNSGHGAGPEIVYALLSDPQGQLDVTASSVNATLLQRVSEPLTQLYLRDRAAALEVLVRQKPVRGIRRLSLKLELPDRKGSLGRLDLGLSTMAIDAELRRSLQRDGLVLLGTMLLAILGALFIGGRIARPLTDLAAAMRRLEQGDFVEVQAASRDEVGELTRSFNQMLQGLRERERLRGTLGRYVSGDVAERILAETDDLSLKGDLRRVTVMFMDVRGFTAMSERLAPAEVVALLNDYFAIVVDRVTAHGGSVNKFIGDAAMCVWGAPRQAADPEREAVACALEIQQASARLSEDRARRGLVAIAFGIGINAGEAVAGNLGAARRLEYTVIGDAVNLAQRLESQARPGEVLVSESVFEKVAGQVEALPREPVKLKGKSQLVPLWEVKRRLEKEAA